MDDATRENFYAPGDDEWGDDGIEYELEPPDAEVIALKRRRAQEDMVASSLAIDVDDIYRDMDARSDSTADQGDWRFQFRIKHWLMLTAALSVILTLANLKYVGIVATLVAMVIAAVALGAMEWREQRRWVEAQRKFREKYERRRAFFERRQQATTATSSNKEEITIYDDLNFNGSPGFPEWTEDAPSESPPFRWQFSIRQMLVATAVAAVALTMIRLLGGPQHAASLLGGIAVCGLLVHALGWDPPEFVVLGWWLILILYILLSIGAALSTAFA